MKLLIICIDSVPASLLLFGLDAITGAVVATTVAAAAADDDDVSDNIEGSTFSSCIFVNLSIDNSWVSFDGVSSLCVLFSISELVRSMSGVDESFALIVDVSLMTVTMESPVDSSITVSATG